MSDTTDDRLNEVGVLKRREIEARIVAPLLERLAAQAPRHATRIVESRAVWALRALLHRRERGSYQ